MLDSLKDSVSSFSHTVADRSSALARRVGPKRGVIALGVIAAAIGASFVARYLKRRSAARTAEPAMENPSGGAPTKKQRRAARHHAHTASPA